MTSFLRGLQTVGGKSTYILLGTVVGWTLFEWRGRSENKSFIRLSVFGTVAVGLMVVVALQEGSLVIPYMLTAPATGKIARSYALEQIDHIETSVRALEQGLAKKDWEAIAEQANRGSEAVDRLNNSAAAVGSLIPFHGQPTTEELRAQLRSANECLQEARQAGRDKDSDAMQAALRKFHECFGPVAKAAMRPQK